MITFFFQVQSSAKVIESAPYGGFRFPIRSLVAGRLFVSFSLDIGLGDAITPPIDEIVGTDWLNFCGIPPAKFEAISIEQQFAEKVHAMIVDRGDRENSRVKDLVDLLLLTEAGLDLNCLTQSIMNTFHRRDKTSIPTKFPLPPQSWRQPFNEMSKECGLKTSFDDAIRIMTIFWDELHSSLQTKLTTI